MSIIILDSLHWIWIGRGEQKKDSNNILLDFPGASHQSESTVPKVSILSLDEIRGRKGQEREHNENDSHMSK